MQDKNKISGVDQLVEGESPTTWGDGVRFGANQEGIGQTIPVPQILTYQQ